jgi:hypothetical protein
MPKPTEPDLRPRPQRPLCLLDVDGVIALLGSRYAEPTFASMVAGFPVTIAVASQERLRRISSVFQVVWATSWQKDAAEHLAPLVGLGDDLPFLSFDPDADRTIGTYKLAVVDRFVRDRPAAWLDDELGEDVVVWASEREHPTLLINCDPCFGITDDHVDNLIDFASRLSLDGPGA